MSRPIALFIPGLNGGGAQKVVVNLANALVDLVDRPIHVVLARAEGEFLRELRSEVQVIDLRTRRASRSIFSLARYLGQAQPEVLCSSLNYANICAILSWLLAGRPCRMVIREDSVVRATDGTFAQRWKQRALHLVMRRLYPLSDLVVAISDGVARSLWSFKICGPEKTMVIGNPIVMDGPSSQTSNVTLLPGIARESRYLCAIGRLTEEKGFDILLDAFAQLPKNDLQLIILGEGHLRHQLQDQARRLGITMRVHLPGFVSAPERILRTAQLFILSSRSEGFGNVLVEALTLGVPIVATDCPGAARDILNHGELGYLVPPEDPTALAEAIQAALTSPKATAQQRKTRAQDFAAPLIARKYITHAFNLSLRPGPLASDVVLPVS